MNGKGILERLMRYSGKKAWFGSVTFESDYLPHSDIIEAITELKDEISSK